MDVASGFTRHLTAATTAISLAVTGVLLSSTTASAATITTNSTGTDGNCFYSLWTDTPGSTTMTTDGAGRYRLTWEKVGNQVSGLGWNPGGARAVTYSGTFTSPGNAYLGIFGYTTSPLTEYYIVDSWGSWRPPGGTYLKDTVTSDGGVYDIYVVQHIPLPSLAYPALFKTFWSVRQTKRVGGTITVGNHVAAWKALGMELGSVPGYQLLATEGYQSSGSSDITVDCG